MVSDLTVGDDPSRSVFTVGERVNIHAVVKNTGDASAGSKSTLEYSISGRPIKDVRISNLSRGKDEATSIPYTFKDEDVGRRTITARADADSDVKEKSGGNNERSVTFTVEKRKYPDLDVAKPTVNGNSSPSRFTVGQTVTIKAVVTNRGDKSVGNSSLQFYLGTKPIGGRIDLGNLNRGASATTPPTISYTFVSGDVGSRSITARAVAGAEEFNKSNNDRSTSTFRVESRKYADLLIKDVKFRVNGREIPPDLAAGERFEIIAVVENDGDATAESFSVAFSIDNRRPLSSTVPSLGRGQSVNVPFTHTFAYEDLGTRVISLFADSTGGVTEKNERNNGREARVKVRQPQPVIGPMHTDRTSVRVGEKVRASITVTNRVNMPELTALLILRVPSGWSVTGRGADNKCVAQCTSIPYTIPTGEA